jgi:hypothetical protein
MRIEFNLLSKDIVCYVTLKAVNFIETNNKNS